MKCYSLNNKNLLYHAAMNLKLLLLTGLVLNFISAGAQFSDTSMYLLRNGQTREWSSFPEIVKNKQLSLRFDMKEIGGAGTLSLTQYDVNQIWKVNLNNKHLG